jgi:hypothetical protein
VGFDRFEAVVGIDQAAGGLGSVIVSVHLDDRETYRSPLLTGNSPPAFLSLPLHGAQTLVLRADPTPDGNQHDHVDWADARLVRDSQSADPKGFHTER